MQKITPEQISACVDGEATSPEMDALLLDVEARQIWARYHLIRDAVQQELPDFVDIDLSSRVAAELSEEATVLAPRTASSSKRWQSVVGMAIAASVFAVVVGVWRPSQPVVSENVADNAAVLPTATMAIETPDEQQQRLEQLLINHSEAAAANGLGVMLPYARVVSDRIEVPVSEPIPTQNKKDKAKKSLEDKGEPR